jgi:undecaprenyl-diphosphatase
MVDQLLELDKKLFLYLNSFHSPWLDPVMLYATDKAVSLPVYLLLLCLILKYYRNDSWAPLLGIAVTIVLADQITSSLMKPLFQRLRPSRDPSLDGLVYIVNGYIGGKYGFASSHAANTFGAAFFFWKLLKQQTRWIALLFVWAGLITYSRIYLGVHYPGDILAGMAVGIAVSVAGLKLCQWLLEVTARKDRLSRDLE